MASVVSLLLRGDDASGVIVATQDNWTGQIFSIPIVDVSATASELSRPGVYVLIGVSEDGEEVPMIYVGEAEAIDNRLLPSHQQLTRDDVAWNRIIIIASKDDDLNKAHVRWIESKLISLANSAKRVRLLNGTRPPTPSLNERELTFIKTFFEHVLMVFPLLTIDAFEAHGSSTSESGLDNIIGKLPELQLKKSGNVLARARPLPNGGLTVLSGAKVLKGFSSAGPNILRLREELLERGLLNDVDDSFWELTQDFDFKSSSAAADVIRGVSLSGPKEWKSADGISLEILRNRTLGS